MFLLLQKIAQPPRTPMQVAVCPCRRRNIRGEIVLPAVIQTTPRRKEKRDKNSWLMGELIPTNGTTGFPHKALDLVEMIAPPLQEAVGIMLPREVRDHGRRVVLRIPAVTEENERQTRVRNAA
ncbi:hypothetical protein NKI66_04055 [Mesorhizobium sp. M0518]|uniref:hypothetical protein n=1 Tax=Mesorhizobium sp. M0518 TaxID=2956956 RepID=UPI00333D7C8D